MALLMVGYLIGKFGAERNGPDGQFSASCPPRLARCARDYGSSLLSGFQGIQRLGGMHSDVSLAPHGFYFDLEGKLARQKVRAPNPFVDPDELGRHVSEMKKRL